MSERSTLRSRLARPAREAAAFGAVGAAGFLVNVAVFNLCLHTLGLATVRSGVIATGAAIAANYAGNRHWTYRHRSRTRIHREAGLFLLFSGIGLVIENGVLALSHYALGFTSTLADNLAKYVVGLGLGTLFRFWSYRTWVFRDTAPAEPVVPAAPATSTGPAAPTAHGRTSATGPTVAAGRTSSAGRTGVAGQTAATHAATCLSEPTDLAGPTG